MLQEEAENLRKSFKSKKKRVTYILKHYPEARNNDNYLCLMYWKIFDNVEKIDDIIFATKPEVIRRTRQKIQNEDLKLLPTDPEVIKSRRLAEKIIRSKISKI